MKHCSQPISLGAKSQQLHYNRPDGFPKRLWAIKNDSTTILLINPRSRRNQTHRPEKVCSMTEQKVLRSCPCLKNWTHIISPCVPSPATTDHLIPLSFPNKHSLWTHRNGTWVYRNGTRAHGSEQPPLYCWAIPSNMSSHLSLLNNTLFVILKDFGPLL